MSAVSASIALPASVQDAEALWYDTGTWPEWVEGCEQVLSVDGDWPQVRAAVSWVSGPAGRGHVTERVLSYEPLRGQTNEVADDSITGVQTVVFTPQQEGVEVTLALEYRISKRGIFTPIVDLLFVRNAVRASLRATLARFGAEFDSAPNPSADPA
jgi:Polyketide cyclase / dehydrase and lipid transport